MLSHGRLGIWQDTFKLIADNPWFGHGPGSFQRIFPGFRSTELGYLFGFLEPVYNSHNVSLEIISESGLIGFLIFMALVVFGTGIHSFRREIFNEKWGMAFFSGLSLLGCGLFSITGEVSHILFCTMFSWLALAVFYNSISGRFKIVRFESKQMHVLLLMPVSALTIASLIFFGTRFIANIQVRKATNVIHSDFNKSLAREHLNRALIFEPRNPFALYQLAYLEMHEGRQMQALEYYRLIRTVDPYFENLHFNMGIAWYSLGSYRNAVECISETLRLYPTFERASFYLSKSYLSLDQYDSAKIWYDHMVKHGSDEKLAEALGKLILAGKAFQNHRP